MVRRIPKSVKAARLLLALDKTSCDVRDFMWRFATGRIPLDHEWKVMKHIGARHMQDTIDSIGDGQIYYYDSLKKESTAELKRKRWITAKDIRLAHQVCKRKK